MQMLPCRETSITKEITNYTFWVRRHKSIGHFVKLIPIKKVMSFIYFVNVHGEVASIRQFLFLAPWDLKTSSGNLTSSKV